MMHSFDLRILACMTGALWAKRGERDISRRARHERKARDEGKRKIKRLALRARVALRAKYRVRPAWLIKRLSCRLWGFEIYFLCHSRADSFSCKIFSLFVAAPFPTQTATPWGRVAICLLKDFVAIIVLLFLKLTMDWSMLSGKGSPAKKSDDPETIQVITKDLIRRLR